MSSSPYPKMDTHITTSSPPLSPTTTFVQADKTTFRDLVQQLTGLDDGDHSPKLPFTFPTRFHKTSSLSRRPQFKLRERRHKVRKLEIKVGLASLDQSPVLSPRLAHMIECSLSLSPVTPLGSELALMSPSSTLEEEEERAIAEKGFYLHPSPLNTPREGKPPELLSLFPLSSVPTQSIHG